MSTKSRALERGFVVSAITALGSLGNIPTFGGANTDYYPTSVDYIQDDELALKSDCEKVAGDFTAVIAENPLPREKEKK